MPGPAKNAKKQKIEWYRTRIFWGAVLLALGSINLSLFVGVYYNPSSDLPRLIQDLAIAFGLIPVVVVSMGILGNLFSILLLTTLITSLIYLSFNSSSVRLRYVLPLAAILVAGFLSAYFFPGYFV